MSRAAKLLLRLQAGHPLSFPELIYVAEAIGFVLARQKGSHRIYRHAATGRLLNLQPDGKDAKRYQVDQLRAIIEETGLKLDD